MPKVKLSVRKESLAVNLFDLDRVDPMIRSILLKDKVDCKPTRMDDSRVDEVGVEFTCSLLDAACIIDTLREHDKRAGESHPTRAYLRRESAWRKIPYGVSLALVVSSRAVLNPEVFGPLGEDSGGELETETISI